MKVGYVIWLEAIDSIFIQTQVLNIVKNYDKSKITLVVFGDIRQLFKRDTWKAFRKIRNQKLEISFIPLVLIPKMNWFFYREIIFPFVFFLSYLPLVYLNYVKQFDVLHFRSYPIILSGLALKRTYHGIRIVFDPRSPFPEECKMRNSWPAKSLSVRMWDYIEKKALMLSDSTVSTSQAFLTQLNEKHGIEASIKVIGNNVDTELFKPDVISRNLIRNKLGIESNTILFVYLGSFLKSTWNNPSIYADFIIHMRKEASFTKKYLFLTRDSNRLIDVFTNKGIRRDEYVTLSAPHAEIVKYLCACDFGMNFMQHPDPRLSIKTVEYLSMGLPIIVNDNVGGAAEIARKHQLGMVLNDFKDTSWIVESVSEDNLRARCRQFAVSNFSSQSVANQYENLYEELLD